MTPEEKEAGREPLFDPNRKTPVWKKIKWKLEAAWTTIRNIPANIRMICEWIPVLWNNWDWDYNFLLLILQYKLKRMSKHIKEHDNLYKSGQIAAQMQACADIIQRLLDNEYDEKEMAALDEKWGELQMDSLPCEYEGCRALDIYRPKAREMGMEDQEREESLAARQEAADRRQKDFEILFRIMNKRIEWWWD